MNGVNLIPIARRNAHRLRRRSRFWGSGCVVYALALVVLCVVVHAKGPPRSAQAKDLASAADRIKELDDSIARETKRLGALEASSEAGKALAERPNWSTLLALVASSLDKDTVLKRCRLDPVEAPAASTAGRSPTKAPSAPPAAGQTTALPRQFQLEIGGLGRSQGAVSAFVLRLQEMGLFEQVELVKTAREPFLSGEAIAFQIRCTLKERARAKP